MSLTSLFGRMSTITSLAQAVNPTPPPQPILVNQNNPKPFIFIQTQAGELSTNGTVGNVIVQSPVMNKGQRGVVRDLNVNFSTVAGAVKISKIRSSGQLIADITVGITNSSSGLGSTVLEEGEAIAVIITTQAAGTLGVFFSGEVYQIG